MNKNQKTNRLRKMRQMIMARKRNLKPIPTKLETVVEEDDEIENSLYDYRHNISKA